MPTGEISAQAHMKNRYSNILTIMAGAVLLLLLLFVIMAYVIREMNLRVQRVITAINRQGINIWETSQEQAKKGSFNLLERSVDHMVHKVKTMMDESYGSKMQEREA